MHAELQIEHDRARPRQPLQRSCVVPHSFNADHPFPLQQRMRTPAQAHERLEIQSSMALKRARAGCSSLFDVDAFTQLGNVFVQTEQVPVLKAAGEALRKLLVGKYAAGEMPAADLCRIAYYHTESGGHGLSDLSFPPSQADHHGSRHVQKMLQRELSKPDLFYVDVPLQDKHAGKRVVHSIPVRLPSETFASIYPLDVDLPAASDQLEGQEQSAYKKHPVVGSHPGQRIVPISLYWDGVSYSKRDSVCAYYFIDCLQNKTYLSFSLRVSLSVCVALSAGRSVRTRRHVRLGPRPKCSNVPACGVGDQASVEPRPGKEDLCDCGCKGWCSLRPLLRTWAWDLQAAATGRRQRLLPAGKAIDAETDPTRFAMMNVPLPVLLAVVECKADWPAWCDTAGLRQWSHNDYPCYCCDCPRHELSSIHNITLDHGPWRTWSDDDYLQEVARCLITVSVTSLRDRQLIFQSIKNNFANRGRTITRDLPRFNLMRGDRMEPSDAVWDVFQFETLTPPFDVVFWRMTSRDRILHTSPLFDIPGISIRSHAIDLLHTWHLGAEACYLGLFFNFVLGSGVFNPSIPYGSTSDNRRFAMMTLKGDLWRYYAERRRTDPSFRRRGSMVPINLCTPASYPVRRRSAPMQ